ncbi:MAG: hypothetical protein HQK51_08890 [Oligoflexia bacterium]|nr:hypothetical protein [Oligoflexia bacterium]
MKCSCIIPAYGRSVEVIEETLLALFSLREEFFSNCIEIFLIDQNLSPLKLDLKFANWPKEYLDKIDYTLYCGKCKSAQLDITFSSKSESESDLETTAAIKFLHIISLNPSTTIAKNYAIALAQAELLLFFDDDVLIQKGAIDAHIKVHKEYADAGFVCGREIIDPPTKGRSKFREYLANKMEKFVSGELITINQDKGNLNSKLSKEINNKRQEEAKYKAQRYVGRVTAESFFLCDFDQVIAEENRVIKINTVRGCNASLKRSIFELSGGFDENFQGTALREESDLCLRLEKIGYSNYYTDKAVAIHRRQLGGCNNLSKSYQALISKYECELLFQTKHFLDKSSFYFFIRLLPLTLENFIRTWGISFILTLQFVYTFFRTTKNN